MRPPYFSATSRNPLVLLNLDFRIVESFRVCLQFHMPSYKVKLDTILCSTTSENLR